MEAAARTRATLAASYLDQEILGLLRTLSALPVASLRTSEGRASTYALAHSALRGTGIEFVARTRGLQILPPAEPLELTATSLDDQARRAAGTAFETHLPQVTPVVTSTGTQGIDLWVAAGTSETEPILLQAHIPESYLRGTLKDFTAGAWMVAVAQSDGEVLTRIGGSPPVREAGSLPLVEAFANTTRFGWRIGASTPLASLDDTVKRNWMVFAIVTTLLTTASFAGASYFSRLLLELNDGSPPRLRTAPGGPVTVNGVVGGAMLTGSTPNGPHLLDRPAKEPTSAENRLRAALYAGGMGVWEWNRHSGNLVWDAKFREVLKLPAGSPGPSAITILRRTDPADRNKLIEAVRAATARNEPLAIDIRVKAFDGRMHWFAVRGSAVKDAAGQINGIVGVGYDITGERQSLSRTDALLREVSHRSKNLLALILAMARLTARDAVDIKSHLRDFALRVTGLAASQDLIVAADWKSVDLSALAFAEIEAVARGSAARVTISGPSFLLTPESAQTLGMILTELALNAVEHGALSTAAGAVALNWEFPSDDTLAISWRETGGPRYDPAGHKGYGMIIVERFSVQGLKVASHISETPDGFIWTLSGLASNIGSRPPPHRT